MRIKIIAVFFFLICAIEGAGAAALWLSMVSDPRHAVLGGFSAARLALLGAAALGSLTSFLLALFCARSRRFPIFASRFSDWISWGSRRFTLAVMPLAVGTVLGFLVNALLNGRVPAWQTAAYRMAPLLVWASLVCFQLGIAFALAFLNRTGLDEFRNWPGVGKAALVTAAALVCGWTILAKTGLGFEVSPGDWIQGPNSPVLFSQVFLVICILALIIILAPQVKSWKRIDYFLAGCLWLAAVILWESTPYHPNFFSTRPFPPNYEAYPYSDAHDYIITGQTLLIGEGYGGHTLILRPLHVLLLTIYHVIAGQNYERVAALQVLVLAFIPALMYWIGRTVHSRPGGVAAALLLILRERNSLLISDMIPGGHTHIKLFMTEMPTVLGMAVLILLLLRWFEDPQKYRRIPLAAGGVLGALVLVRSNSVGLLLFLAILMIFWSVRKPRSWLPAVLLLVIGTALFVAPWLGRSYRMTGYLELEKAPSYSHYYETVLITGKDEPQLPGESGNEYNARLTGIIADYVVKHPLEVLKFTSAHFFHNEINTTLVLPVQPDFSGLKEYVKENILWSGGKYRPQAVLDTAMLLMNIAVVGIGIGAAFRRRKGLVLVPLAVRFGYNLTLALGRRSGGRYFMPGDWIGLLMFGLGLAELVLWAAVLLGSLRPGNSLRTGSVDPRDDSGPKKTSLRSYLVAGLIILTAGMILPAAEWVVPPRYQNLNPEQVADMLQSRNSGEGDDNPRILLQKLNSASGVQVKWGRGLYPRYFQAGEGLRSAEALLDIRRLRFEVIGPQPGEVILQDIEPPGYFPDASDVAVFGCRNETYLDALLVVVLDPDGDHYYWRNPASIAWECPPP